MDSLSCLNWVDVDGIASIYARELLNVTTSGRRALLESQQPEGEKQVGRTIGEQEEPVHSASECNLPRYVSHAMNAWCRDSTGDLERLTCSIQAVLDVWNGKSIFGSQRGRNPVRIVNVSYSRIITHKLLPDNLGPNIVRRA